MVIKETSGKVQMLWDVRLEYLRAVNRHFDPLSSLQEWPSQYRQPFHSDSACKALLKAIKFFCNEAQEKEYRHAYCQETRPFQSVFTQMMYFPLSLSLPPSFPSLSLNWNHLEAAHSHSSEPLISGQISCNFCCTETPLIWLITEL